MTCVAQKRLCLSSLLSKSHELGLKLLLVVQSKNVKDGSTLKIRKSGRCFYLLSLWMKSLRVTIQIEATEQYFPVVLFIMLYKVVLTFESVDES